MAARRGRGLALWIFFGFLVIAREGYAEPRDVWGELWAHPGLAALDRATLDRDAPAVLAAAQGPELAAAPEGVRARARWLEARALEQEGRYAEGARALGEAREGLERGGERGLGVHARYHEARLWLEVAGESERALKLLRGLEGERAALPGFELHLARALIGSGRAGEGLGVLRGLHPRRGDDLWPVRDELLYLEGLAQWRLGAASEAQATLRTLVERFPASRRVGSALGLVSLRFSPEERLKLADAFLDARDYRGAIAALRPVSEAAGPLQQEARYQLGYVEYRLRRADREAGIALLEQVAGEPGGRRADAWVLLARASMRHDDYAGALKRWRSFRTRFPRDKRAHEALYYEGWLPMDQGRYEAASAGFARYLEAWPGGGRAEEARWFLGWSRWQAGDAAGAAEAWEEAQRHVRGGSLEAGQVLYWRSRALEQAGRRREAREEAARLEREHGWTYYGRLQAIRRGEEAALYPGSGALGEALSPGEAWAALDALEGPLQAEVRRVRDLVHLGLYEEARRRGGEEVQRRVVSARRAPGAGPSGEALAFFIAEEVGDVEGAFRAAARQHAPFVKPPSEATREVWRRAYPRPYRRLVEHEAAKRGVSPWLLWAIMQKESAYDARALSYADAMGLMQIIPKTGARIAAELGEVYREGMLFDPQVNIAYAAWYLSMLQRKFHGQVAMAAAAYNGGPLAVDGWLRARPEASFDAWVEEIGFDQARTYARKVLTILGRYIMVYGSRTGRGDPLVDGLYPPGMRVRADSLPIIDF